MSGHARLSAGPGRAICQPQMKLRTLIPLLLAMASGAAIAEKPAPVKDPAPARNVSPELKAALEKLELPGVKLNLEEWSVDVESRVCLKEGLLELIACTKDTKEHESIIAIEAKPSHVHAALLLLGAKPGSPASQQAIDPEMTRFRHILPSGSPVDVYLVFKDEKGVVTESPISDFLMRAEGFDATGESTEPKEKFPTHTFLFAGSILYNEGDGPRQYLCDSSGNVISITTFGDELLCLPGFSDHSNEALMWQVNGEKLPALDSKITLRLRPQVTARAAAPTEDETPATE
jgi:hypothetical protein